MTNKSKINKDLIDYVENHILPLYDSFDLAHQRDHALNVISESLSIAPHYEVNTDMVYAIAAFHDIGLQEGREKHHLVSGRMIRNNTFLKKHFSDEEVEIMAQAAEDHRASSHHTPRSIYGMIVAEADRTIDASTIVRRTIEFSLSHYPSYSKEEHYERFIKHMKEKYAEGGYLQLYIPLSANAARLAAFRLMLKDRQQTRELFDKEWNKLSAHHQDSHCS